MAKPRYLPTDTAYRTASLPRIPRKPNASAKFINSTLQAIPCKKSQNACKPLASHTAMRQAGTRTPFTAS